MFSVEFVHTFVTIMGPIYLPAAAFDFGVVSKACVDSRKQRLIQENTLQF
jgi:hypothetical protein